MQREYVLGHSDVELQRLEQQGAYLRDLTRSLLVRAGVRAGMRVLDFGAGAGDVALLAADLVGPSGEVIAVDRSADALARMRARLEARGVGHVRAVAGDEHAVAELARERPFDAVVGRLVLLHQPDPIATLNGLIRALRPGGVVAFHEIEIEAGWWSEPRFPLAERVSGWLFEALTRVGTPRDIGRRMARAYEQAGLVERRVFREGVMESGPDSTVYAALAQTLRSLLPVLIRAGVATEDDVQIDTLADRLRAEAVATGSQFIPFFLAGASAVVPT